MADPLTPYEAAQRILKDIRQDEDKLEKLVDVPRNQRDFCVGNEALHTIYRTPTCGHFEDYMREFNKKLYGPLDFELDPAPKMSEDSSDIEMMRHLGKLIKDLAMTCSGCPPIDSSEE